MHGYLCFVPRAAAPDDARWECSDDTPVEDPVLHHMKAGSHAAVFSIKTALPITTNNHYNTFNLSFYSITYLKVNLWVMITYWIASR